MDVLLLDKTGTITLGNRQAAEFLPLAGVAPRRLAEAAQLASLADETPEGRSVVVLAKRRFGLRAPEVAAGAGFVPFSAQTRLSGVDLPGRRIRKGAADAVRRLVTEAGGGFPREAEAAVNRVAREGGTPLVVAENGRVLGVVWLKDIVKGGIRERSWNQALGIKRSGSPRQPLTAAAIAAGPGWTTSGRATPTKLLIRDCSPGRLWP